MQRVEAGLRIDMKKFWQIRLKRYADNGFTLSIHAH